MRCYIFQKCPENLLTLSLQKRKPKDKKHVFLTYMNNHIALVKRAGDDIDIKLKHSQPLAVTTPSAAKFLGKDTLKELSLPLRIPLKSHSVDAKSSRLLFSGW